MVHASPPSRRRLVGGGAPRRSPAAPLTVVSPDKIVRSGFCCFEHELSALIRFVFRLHDEWSIQVLLSSIKGKL
jgi:hypothetical protein